LETKATWATCVSDAIKALGIDPCLLAIVIIVLGCLYFVHKMQQSFNNLQLASMKQLTDALSQQMKKGDEKNGTN
jgi:hypothetical protein